MALKLAIRGIFLLGLLGLIGCKAKSNAEGKEEPLIFAVGGVPAELAEWEKVANDYARATGQAVELLRQPADSDQRRQGLVVSLQASQAEPDLFLMDVAWVAQFAASGWLAPLPKDSLPGEGSFPSGALSASEYGGATVALPVYIDGGLLYYRRDLLEKYGYRQPPQTWDELQAMALKVQSGERKNNPDFYGYVWQGAQYEGLVCHFLEVALSSGGGLPILPDRLEVESAGNAKALSTMQNWLGNAGISPPETYTSMKEEEVRLYFQKGSALFERNWPYAWSLHESEDSPVKGKVGIAPLPHFDGHASAATLGGWHIGISKFSRRRSAALKFLNHVVSLPVQKRLALRLGWNPGRTEIYGDSSVLARLPHFQALGEVFAHAQARPGLPYWTPISEVLQKHFNAALAGRESSTTALQEAQTGVDALWRRYHTPAEPE